MTNTDCSWYTCAQCDGGLLAQEHECRVPTPDGVCEPCLRVNRAYERLDAINNEIVSTIKGRRS